MKQPPRQLQANRIIAVIFALCVAFVMAGMIVNIELLSQALGYCLQHDCSRL